MYSSVVCPPLPFGAMVFRLSIFASSASISKNYNFFDGIRMSGETYSLIPSALEPALLRPVREYMVR